MGGEHKEDLDYTTGNVVMWRDAVLLVSTFREKNLLICCLDGINIECGIPPKEIYATLHFLF